MSRLSVINPATLPPMEVLEKIDSEVIIAARMARLVLLWNENDPPAGAAYDVSSLEFDPLKINQELCTYFETLLRDRVNQAARSVTLAYAIGGDLEAIASRYPGGIPRLEDEDDERYRRRVWLSSNLLSPHGTYEAYVFWAMTADPTLHDASAVAVRVPGQVAGTGKVNVYIVPTGNNPVATQEQLRKVYEYIEEESRKGLTDIINVLPAKVTHIKYRIRYWLFPAFDQATVENDILTSLQTLITNQYWIGYDHMRMAIDAAISRPGVYNAIIDEPVHDVLVGYDGLVKVDSIELSFVGRGE